MFLDVTTGARVDSTAQPTMVNAISSVVTTFQVQPNIIMVECNCDKMQSKILSLLIVEKCETKKIIVKQQCSEFTTSYSLVEHSKFVV